MKQHIGVMAMIARSSFYKMIVLFLGMIVAEFILFSRTQNVSSLEDMISRSRIGIVLLIGFIILTIILCRVGCEFGGSKQGYTLQRLPVLEREIYFWQALYNGCSYVMLLLLQIVLLFVFSKMFVKNADPGMYSQQTIFLALYRSKLFHSLLPMADVFAWVANIITVIALAVSSAVFPYRQRRGSFGGEILVQGIVTCFFFVGEMGRIGGALISMGIAAVLIFSSIYYVCQRKEGANEGI